MRLSSYLKIFPCPDAPGNLLLYSTRRCSVVRISAKNLRQVEEGTLSEDDSATLARLGILVADPAAEREEMLNRFAEANRRARQFRAIVVLNLDCNLACPYCFEEGVRVGRYMSPETADNLVAMLERDHLDQGCQVALDFYGGEPLLSLDLIRSIAARLKNASDDRGLPFSFALVTNGTLLNRPLAEELKTLGLKDAKVTLDGPREVHDLSRPFASGKGSSFDVIVRNLAAVREIIDIELGGNFTRENYPEFPRLLDDLISVGITPDRLRMVQFCPVMNRREGLSVPDFRTGCDCTSEPWLHEASLFLREETLKRGFTAPKPGAAGCMVEFGNALVVSVDGSLYKCPAFVGREGFAVGDLRSGITSDGAVYNPDIWKKPECLDCFYLPQCFGGCRFLKFVRDGSITDVDCWKSFFDATLEESIRQDQRYRPGKPGR
jgi:uncharacterized protein